MRGIVILGAAIVAASLLAVGFVFGWLVAQPPAVGTIATSITATSPPTANLVAEPVPQEVLQPAPAAEHPLVGKTLPINVDNRHPQPLMGVPVPTTNDGRLRVAKVSKIDDAEGWLSECDGRSTLFARVGTLVLVLSVEPFDGEPWAEVRFKSGPYAQRTGWIPVGLLSEWKLTEKLSGELNEKRWPKEKRQAIVKDYFAALDQALAKADLKAKRLDVEMAAAKAILPLLDKVMRKHNVDFDGELQAIVISELAAGERPAFTDR